MPCSSVVFRMPGRSTHGDEVEAADYEQKPTSDLREEVAVV